MTRRNKRKSKKVGYYSRTNSNTGTVNTVTVDIDTATNDEVTTETDTVQSKAEPVMVPQNLEPEDSIETTTISIDKKKCLRLIAQISGELNGDYTAKLVTILEMILSVFKADPKKRDARLSVIGELLPTIQEYNSEGLGKLKNKLDCIFFPKELRKLMVEHGDIKETFSFIPFLFLGVFIGGDVGIVKSKSLKVQIKEAIDDDDSIKIVHEAKILARLQHGHIIKIIAFDKIGPTLALEYMKLGNLREALMDYNFSDKKLLTMLKEIISGMVYLAKEGYVHRVLNTRSIVLDGQGIPKITNFSYCQYVGESDGVFVDEDTDFDCSYAAPEVKSLKQFSTKSDVWDLAILAWEIFFLEPGKEWAFEPATEKLRPMAIFEKHGLLRPGKFPFFLWNYFKNSLLHKEPSERPSFSDITEKIDSLADIKLF